jgi:hypothetical protein
MKKRLDRIVFLQMFEAGFLLSHRTIRLVERLRTGKVFLS